MRSETTYRFTGDEIPCLSAARVSEIAYRLNPYALPEDEGMEINGRPIARASGPIKGNQFTAQNVADFARYASILLDRGHAQLRALQEEARTVPKDEFSRKAYEGLVDGIADGLASIRRDLEDFLAAFEQERLGFADAA